MVGFLLSTTTPLSPTFQVHFAVRRAVTNDDYFNIAGTAKCLRRRLPAVVISARTTQLEIEGESTTTSVRANISTHPIPSSSTSHAADSARTPLCGGRHTHSQIHTHTHTQTY